MAQTEISTRSSDPGPSSRAFHWPVLEAGNDSFPGGIYTVTCTDKDVGKAITLRHRVQDAPLIEQWIEQGKLTFVCSVAAPRSMYRTLHQSETPEQAIAWQRDDLGEYPMFTPMIVAGVDIQHTASVERDGLNRIWDGRKLDLPQGARIAVGSTFKFKSGIDALLQFNLDESLAPGQFAAHDSTEDGFKFKVSLASNLYHHLKHRREEPAGANIMVHVVSAAFSVLQRDWREDDGDEGEGWQSFRNLVGLADFLQSRGLPRWDDDDFRPEKVATALYPHQLPPEVD